MLLLKDEKGERQVTPKELETMFKIPLKKIKKRKLFELNDSFKKLDLGATVTSGKRQYRTPQGVQRSAVFSFENEDGFTCSLRYCTQMPHKKDTGRGVVDVYTPRKVRIDGEGSTFKEDDLAVFFYLHPENRQSPLRGNRVYWSWQYNDPDEAAQNVVAEVTGLQEAINHAMSLKGAELRIFAKGSGFPVDSSLSDDAIRTPLLQWAATNPVDYNSKRLRRSTSYDGLIQDCIERGIFVFMQKGFQKYWVWGDGPYKDAVIVTIDTHGLNQDEVLKSFMREESNLVKYRTIIEQLHLKSVGLEAADDVLEDQGAFNSIVNPAPAPAPKSEPSTLTVPDPENHQEVVEFLKSAHPSGAASSFAMVKEFKEAIKDGSITPENIDTEVLKYLSKKP